MSDVASRTARRSALVALALLASVAWNDATGVFVAPARQQGTAERVDITLPLAKGSLRLGVIGDSGTGDRAQYEVGDVLERVYREVELELVLMLGDNMYGRERPQDFLSKFEKPYQALLEGGVKFYAALGNHDDPNQRFYKPFNMNGRRYYTFTRGAVRFFALDSNYFDREQEAWFEREVSSATEKWKICFMHHPIYSSGERHGSEIDLRRRLEPLLVQHGVSVVFAGHEHFYERLKPQQGIQYFTNGGAAKLRAGNIARNSPLTEKGFDRDRSFMIVEIDGDRMHFQTLSRTGATVDSGTILRRGAERDTSGSR
jgi:hypothetical protein